MRGRKGAGGKTPDTSKPIDTPVGELGEKDTIMHYNAVLIEDLKSKMELVLEYVQALDVKIEAFRTEVSQKIGALNYKIDRLGEHLSSRIDQIAARLDRHDVRLAALESCH